MIKKFVVLTLLVSFLLTAVSCSSGKNTINKEFLYGTKLLSDPASIAKLRTESLSGSASSYDRGEGNADGFGTSNFLYEENGEKVMMDTIGAGTIYRIWFTGFDNNAYIKIRIDGEETPSINMKLMDMFDQKHKPFTGLLSVSDVISSGGFVSYVPISFRKSIKITTNGTGGHFFYNVNYQLYEQGTELTPYTSQESMDSVQNIWHSVTEVPKYEKTKNKTSTVNLKSGQSIKLANLSGKKIIRSLRIKVPGISRTKKNLSKENIDILNNLKLKIIWDKEAKPAVDAPIGMFFAMGSYGFYKTESLYVGIDKDDYLYCTFPMPFEKSASLSLESTLSKEITGIVSDISYLPLEGNFDDYGYFRTQYRDKIINTNADILLMEEKTGQGQLVGVVQSVRSPKNQGWGGLGYLEGDEKAYIDGSGTPSIHGTGCEDFYNGGWYFNRGVFTTPTAGYTHFSEDNKYTYTAMYRLMYGDAVTYRNGLKFTIEHGPGNNVSVTSKALAYYYHRDKSSVTLSDKLSIGDKDSESIHKYSVTGKISEEDLMSKYENLSSTKFKAFSRNHKGTSEFTLTIDPKNNGAILRRTFDQFEPNQSAKIYVDGELEGTWYFAGGNQTLRYRDTEFIIPEKLTKGKNNLKIKIEYVDTAAHWSEISYTLFSLLQ